MNKEYIKREAILEIIRDKWFYNSGQIFQALLSLPADDIVEVRHGYWEEQLDGTHYCSECGHDATYTYDGAEICGVACPFYGAKMDKKGEGE